MILSDDDLEMLLRIFAAVVAGALIGYERSYHARPAGFRTHTLVCTASSLLMLVTVYEAHWVRAVSELVRLDPTRMAQGIMTGIGFLGAGVIIKEGLSVRGMDTDGVRRHSMIIRSTDRTSAERLYETLEKTESVVEFRIAPTGD